MGIVIANQHVHTCSQYLRYLILEPGRERNYDAEEVVIDDIVTAYSTQEKVYETDEKTWCSAKFRQTKLFKP